MICATCHGKGTLRYVLPAPIPVGEEPQGPGLPHVIIEATAVNLPCPTCGGCGFDHCCSGDREQPE